MPMNHEKAIKNVKLNCHRDDTKTNASVYL